MLELSKSSRSVKDYAILMWNLSSCQNYLAGQKATFRSLPFWNLSSISQVHNPSVVFIWLHSLSCSFHVFIVSLNLLKTLPPSRVDKRFEEGSPGDLQTLESYFNAAARQLAGIKVPEPVGPRKSVDTITCSSVSARQAEETIRNEGNLLALILSVLESNNHGDFKLHDGLRLPGIRRIYYNIKNNSIINVKCLT